MTCTCPSTQLEAYAKWHDLSASEQWRRYHLQGGARTGRHELHHPGCPLRQTREQKDAERMMALDLTGLSVHPGRFLASDDLPGSY